MVLNLNNNNNNNLKIYTAPRRNKITLSAIIIINVIIYSFILLFCLFRVYNIRKQTVYNDTCISSLVKTFFVFVFNAEITR